MKTPHDIYLESIAEFDLKFSTLVAEHEDGTTTRKGVNPEMLDHIKSHTIRMLEADIERLGVEKRKHYLKGDFLEHRAEYNIGHNQALQTEIDYKKKELTKIQGV